MKKTTRKTTKKWMQRKTYNALRNGEIRTNGTEIVGLMPPFPALAVDGHGENR